MIDVHGLTRNIIEASQMSTASALEETAKGLADCWDDCAAITLDQVRRGRANDVPDMNPYRAAVDGTRGDLSAPSVEFVDEPTPDGRTRHLFVTTVDDDELAAMQIIMKALDNLDERTQNRVIMYISERVAYETRPQH